MQPVEPASRPRTLTAKQVASLLGVSHHRVCKMAANGELPAFRNGTHWKFSVARIYEILGEEPPQ